MPAAERGRSRAVLFSEAALRQDPEQAVEELRHVDVGVVVFDGTVVVADSGTFAQRLEEVPNVDLSEVLERLHNLQPGTFQIDVGSSLLFNATSGATVQLTMTGIQLPSPDDEEPPPQRYRCTNLA
ncbi:hypothetical protein [Tenggerimyces flavus]|uniref:Uncharacterized protein n=1 Tax=Tenggerimyces flavus TaxID=1708749 RepID=A0ABV7YMX7_9ACTN|nr:hypothetical protein [Tenggerimyces flavus]MBM7787729.1 hypothetical protein [Tenggerimyces flavus]